MRSVFSSRQVGLVKNTPFHLRRPAWLVVISLILLSLALTTRSARADNLKICNGAGDTDKLSAACTLALNSLPRDSIDAMQALVRRSELKASKADWSGAFADLDEVILRTPQQPCPYLRRAKMLLNAPRDELVTEAIDFDRRMATVLDDLDTADALGCNEDENLVRGDLNYAAGRLESAAKDYREHERALTDAVALGNLQIESPAAIAAMQEQRFSLMMVSYAMRKYSTVAQQAEMLLAVDRSQPYALPLLYLARAHLIGESALGELRERTAEIDSKHPDWAHVSFYLGVKPEQELRSEATTLGLVQACEAEFFIAQLVFLKRPASASKELNLANQLCSRAHVPSMNPILDAQVEASRLGKFTEAKTSMAVIGGSRLSVQPELSNTVRSQDIGDPLVPAEIKKGFDFAKLVKTGIAEYFVSTGEWPGSKKVQEFTEAWQTPNVAVSATSATDDALAAIEKALASDGDSEATQRERPTDASEPANTTRGAGEITVALRDDPALEGQFVVQFHGLPALKGKAIVFTPTVANGSVSLWLCKSEGVADRHLPADCRGEGETAQTLQILLRSHEAESPEHNAYLESIRADSEKALLAAASVGLGMAQKINVPRERSRGQDNDFIGSTDGVALFTRANGAVEVRFRSPSKLAGRSLLIAPLILDGSIANWACSSTNIEDTYLPPVCRRGYSAELELEDENYLLTQAILRDDPKPLDSIAAWVRTSDATDLIATDKLVEYTRCVSAKNVFGVVETGAIRYRVSIRPEWIKVGCAWVSPPLSKYAMEKRMYCDPPPNDVDARCSH